MNNITFYEDFKYTDKESLYLREKTHYYIDKVTKSLESFQYNVSVAQIREFSNIFLSFDITTKNQQKLIALKFSLTKWIIIISPMIPHLAEELWKILGYEDSLASSQSWPKANLSLIKETTVNIVVQVNGKKKLILNIPKDLTAEQTKHLLMGKEDIKKIIKDKKIKKIITIPNKIFSLVI